MRLKNAWLSTSSSRRNPEIQRGLLTEMDDVPHEHSRLGTPESEVATHSFNKHDAFYDPVERNSPAGLDRGQSLALSYRYHDGRFVSVADLLPSVHCGTGVDPLRT